MMVDSRQGFTKLDRQLLGFMEPRLNNGSVRLLVLLTKCDKLSRAEAQRALEAAQGVLGEVATDEADLGVTLFSALNRSGVDDVALQLHDWAAGSP